MRESENSFDSMSTQDWTPGKPNTINKETTRGQVK